MTPTDMDHLANKIADKLRDNILVTEKDAAKLLGFSERTVFDLRSRGELAFIREGRAIRYHVESLKAWAASKLENVGDECASKDQS